MCVKVIRHDLVDVNQEAEVGREKCCQIPKIS